MRHPYDDFIQNVEKPARYLGGEYLSITKDWSKVEATLCLAFPDIYDIGMSHLGTKILYSLVNKHPKLLCERAFSPWFDMEKELRERKLSLLSLESARPLRDFDVVGISLQYELTFTNVLQLLDLSQIPLRTKQRELCEPLILGGGPTATHPEAVAPFFDAFLLGDAEERLPEILLAWVSARRDASSREEALAVLAKIPGLYVPCLYRTSIDPKSGFEVVVGTTRDDIPQKPKRQVLNDINRYPFPDDSPVAVAEAIFDRMSIEIARGCTEGCRFCQAGMIYRPVRERDPEEIVNTILSSLEKGGYDEVSLTSLSTADYSCISPLLKKVMERLREKKVSLSVSSLRAYGLEEDLLDEIASVRATGLTFAPEAGTQRMRDVITKNITDDDLMRTAHRVFSRGWKRMKLYFMIGLPTETHEDVNGIIETGAKMRDVGLDYWKKQQMEVTCSVSTHVPKPHTPFQWFAFDSLEEISQKHRLLEDAAKRFKVRVKYHNARASYLEAILGRADRRVADLVEKAFLRGCRFDGWDDRLQFSVWEEVLKESGLDLSLYLDEIATDARLPWDHLDMLLEEKFLEREYRKTLRSRLSPPCGKAFGDQVHHSNLVDALAALPQKLVCYDCGLACDLIHMKEERIDFLQVLGANQKPETKPALPYTSVGRHDTPPKFEQLEPVWYRLRFHKTGVAALSGHLDLVRNFPRILRRAGLSSYYSQGFHPKPLIVFSPALSLGVMSLAEYVDIALTDTLSSSELLARLREVSPEGIDFVKAVALPPKTPSIAKVIAWAEYLVASSIPLSLDLDVLSERISRVSQGESMLVFRQKKASKRHRRPKKREVDISPFIETLSLVTRPKLSLITIPADRVVLHMKLRVNGSGNARPKEILDWVSEGKLEAKEMIRTELLLLDGTEPVDGISVAPRQETLLSKSS